MAKYKFHYRAWMEPDVVASEGTLTVESTNRYTAIKKFLRLRPRCCCVRIYKVDD